MIWLTMYHECTGTSLSIFNTTVLSYNYVLKDPDLVIDLASATPYLV